MSFRFFTDGTEIFQSFIGETTIGWFSSIFVCPPYKKREKISIPHSIWHNQNYYTDKNCKETQIKYNKAK